ncbi:DUF397 domain-containing protein [Actinomadura sp. 7K507]|uniref:DUF397 domain-containing protein n=1 Tax=Actinomadura sp. 7K507 TaxID=2530365 RepID=UPI001FB63D8E|nr:DUF397 domain-containing protein [Actinomadura sp. 7K507]
MTPCGWRRSSKSTPGRDCVEVAELSNVIGVRDSKYPEGGHLARASKAFKKLV